MTASRTHAARDRHTTGVLRQKRKITGDIAAVAGSIHIASQRAALAIVKTKFARRWASFGDLNLRRTDHELCDRGLADAAQKIDQFQVASFDPLIGKRRHKGGGIWQAAADLPSIQRKALPSGRHGAEQRC